MTQFDGKRGLSQVHTVSIKQTVMSSPIGLTL